MLLKENYNEDNGSRAKQACIGCQDTADTLRILKETLILSIFGLRILTLFLYTLSAGKSSHLLFHRLILLTFNPFYGS